MDVRNGLYIERTTRALEKYLKSIVIPEFVGPHMVPLVRRNLMAETPLPERREVPAFDIWEESLEFVQFAIAVDRVYEAHAELIKRTPCEKRKEMESAKERVRRAIYTFQSIVLGDIDEQWDTYKINEILVEPDDSEKLKLLIEDAIARGHKLLPKPKRVVRRRRK